MKAIIHTAYGPPEVVSMAEIEKPEPGKGEVLIKVYATTVNRTDCGFRSAEYFISRLFSGLFKPKNKTLGNEFAGVVETIGKEITAFKPGDRVFGYNDKSFGAHAEYMIMKEKDAIVHMPSNLTFEEAAPISEGAHYALNDLRASKVHAGQKILVNGATGAIGSAAVQLAKAMGCNVTAVCATSHIDLVKSLGASRAIDYTKEDFTLLTEQFDLVFDAVGKSSFGRCKKILKKNGIYISTELGKHSENIFLALITPFGAGKKVLFPIPTISKDDLFYFKDLIEKKEFMPVIDRRYKLEQIRDAYRYVETGQKIGNVVITVV